MKLWLDACSVVVSPHKPIVHIGQPEQLRWGQRWWCWPGLQGWRWWRRGWWWWHGQPELLIWGQRCWRGGGGEYKAGDDDGDECSDDVMATGQAEDFMWDISSPMFYRLTNISQDYLGSFFQGVFVPHLRKVSILMHCSKLKTLKQLKTKFCFVARWVAQFLKSQLLSEKYNYFCCAFFCLCFWICIELVCIVIVFAFVIVFTFIIVLPLKLFLPLSLFLSPS